MRLSSFVYAIVISCVLGILAVPRKASAEGALDGKFLCAYGAISIPRGDFGDSESGCAVRGFGGGYEHLSPISSAPGLYTVTSIFILNNGVDLELNPCAEVASSLPSGWSCNASDVDYGSYWNFPIMGGLRHQGMLSSTVRLFGQAQAGVNFVKMPSMDFDLTICDSYNCVDASGKTTMDVGVSFAFGLSIGALLNDKVVFALQYFNFGTPKADGEMEISAGGMSETASMELRQPISTLLFSVGFVL